MDRCWKCGSTDFDIPLLKRRFGKDWEDYKVCKSCLDRIWKKTNAFAKKCVDKGWGENLSR